jgi:hypothetical protein
MYMFARVYVRKKERSAEQIHTYSKFSSFVCISFKVSVASTLIIDLQATQSKHIYIYIYHISRDKLAILPVLDP